MKIYDQNYKNWDDMKNQTGQFNDGLEILQNYRNEFLKNKSEIYEKKIKKAIQNVYNYFN